MRKTRTVPNSITRSKDKGGLCADVFKVGKKSMHRDGGKPLFIVKANQLVFDEIYDVVSRCPKNKDKLFVYVSWKDDSYQLVFDRKANSGMAIRR